MPPRISRSKSIVESTATATAVTKTNAKGRGRGKAKVSEAELQEEHKESPTVSSSHHSKSSRSKSPRPSPTTSSSLPLPLPLPLTNCSSSSSLSLLNRHLSSHISLSHRLDFENSQRNNHDRNIIQKEEKHINQRAKMGSQNAEESHHQPPMSNKNKIKSSHPSPSSSAPLSIRYKDVRRLAKKFSNPHVNPIEEMKINEEKQKKIAKRNREILVHRERETQTQTSKQAKMAHKIFKIIQKDEKLKYFDSESDEENRHQDNDRMFSKRIRTRR